MVLELVWPMVLNKRIGYIWEAAKSQSGKV